MNFLVDVHLPRRLVYPLRAAGHDAIHTLDLPAGNAMTDIEINDISERERPVVVTEDADFVNSFLTVRKPYKLLLISTGNMSNSELEALFVPAISIIVAALSCCTYKQ